MGSERATGFDCRVCGQHHDVLPLSYSVKAPHAIAAIPPEELEQRVVITHDQCVIDNRDFYLRGRIPIPIHGLTNHIDDPFIWGVWAEVGPKDFIRTNQLWQTPGREHEPPFPAYLDTELPIFGNTLNLELLVHTQPVGRRPHFTILNPEHPLAIEQRNGITLSRVQEIAETLLHSIPREG